MLYWVNDLEIAFDCDQHQIHSRNFETHPHEILATDEEADYHVQNPTQLYVRDFPDVNYD